jgi:hypothetical protein
MLTYAEITRNGLLKIGVIDETQAVSAIQVQDGIRILNEMMDEGQESGSIKLGFVPGTLASDVVKIPQWAERAVTYDLAWEFTVEYHVATTQEFRDSRDESHQRLLARSMGENTADLSYLPGGQSKRNRGQGKAPF